MTIERKMFVVFLKKHKCLGNYMSNVYSAPDEFRKHRLNMYAVIPELYVWDAFYWAHTAEGAEFWGKLHDLWKDVCRRNLQKFHEMSY